MVSLSTALHQFEQSLQELVTQLNEVSGSLRPDDIQLSRSLMVVCQQAVRLRVLIRAEDPQATWSSHQQLREVVERLESRVPLAPASALPKSSTPATASAPQPVLAAVGEAAPARKAQFENAILAGDFVGALSLCSDGATDEPARASGPALLPPPAARRRSASASEPQPAAAIAGMSVEESYQLLTQMMRQAASASAEPPRDASASQPGATPTPAAFAAPVAAAAPREIEWQFTAADSQRPARKGIGKGLWIGAIACLVLAVLIALMYYFIPSAQVSLPAVVPSVKASTPPLISPPTDAEIQADVQQRLSVLKGSPIRATVSGGVVTLVGRTYARKRAKAATLASQASGVKSVDNQIQVVPFGPGATSDAAPPPVEILGPQGGQQQQR